MPPVHCQYVHMSLCFLRSSFAKLLLLNTAFFVNSWTHLPQDHVLLVDLYWFQFQFELFSLERQTSQYIQTVEVRFLFKKIDHFFPTDGKNWLVYSRSTCTIMGKGVGLAWSRGVGEGMSCRCGLSVTNIILTPSRLKDPRANLQLNRSKWWKQWRMCSVKSIPMHSRWVMMPINGDVNPLSQLL